MCIDGSVLEPHTCDQSLAVKRGYWQFTTEAFSYSQPNKLRWTELGAIQSVIKSLAILCLPLLAAAQNQTTVAIRNAKIVTISGPVLNKGTVILKDGLIEAVGENVSIPAGAWIIEGDGLTVYPGLIDGLSTVGLIPPPVTIPTTTAPTTPPARGPEDRPRTTSWERAADKVRANDPRIDSARNAGFTSVVTFPTTGIFAGQGAVVNMAGDNPSKMIVESPAGQYMTLAGAGGQGAARGFPSSGMGVYAYVRQIFIDLDYYEKTKAAYQASPAGKQRPAYDRALEGIKESGRLLLPAGSKVEMERVMRLASELNMPFVLYGAQEGYRTSEQLKQGKVSVLVSAKWPAKIPNGDPDAEESLRTLEVRENAPGTPAALAKDGVKFAFYSDGQTPAEFIKGVRLAVERGLSHDDAVKALSLSTAEIFGIANRLGSVEKGKIANLVISKGDLLAEKSAIQFVFVDGIHFVPSPDAAPATVVPPGATGRRPRTGDEK